MTCPRCGASVDGLFCAECGARVASTDRRHAWPPLLAVLGVVVAVGVTGLAAFVITDQFEKAGGPAPWVTSTVTRLQTTTQTVTATMTATSVVTVSISPSEPSTATSPSPPMPQGLLAVDLRPSHGFGQESVMDRRCSEWVAGFANLSDTAINRIVVAPRSAEYTGAWNGHDFETRRAARPAPAVLDVYLAAGQRQILRFQTCTSTSPPSSQDFEFGAIPPRYATFRWATGYEGRTCFRC